MTTIATSRLMNCLAIRAHISAEILASVEELLPPRIVGRLCQTPRRTPDRGTWRNAEVLGLTHSGSPTFPHSEFRNPHLRRHRRETQVSEMLNECNLSAFRLPDSAWFSWRSFGF